MDITWHGYSCFTIKTKGGTVVVNPYKDGMGLKLPKLKADIAVITHNYKGYDNLEALGLKDAADNEAEGGPYLIDWPGEYEVKGISFTCFQIPESEGMFFTMHINGLTVCFIEKVGQELDDDLIDNIGDVDILVISVGDAEILDAAKAHAIMEKIEPRCVIPMNYSVEGTTASLESREKFLKTVGAGEKIPEDKLSVQGKSSFREDSTEIAVLNPQL